MSRKTERILSVISLGISLFMMYGIGRDPTVPKYLMIISVLFGISAVICAGILE